VAYDRVKPTYWCFNNIFCQEEMFTANVSSCRFMFLDFFTLKKEAVRSFEMSLTVY